MIDHTINPSERAVMEFVGIDWGSSNFRMLIYSPSGLDVRVDPQGVADLDKAEFPRYLKQRLDAQQIPAETPVLMCGMVGSRAGWQEVPYVEAPMHLSELGQHLVRVEEAHDRPIFIVPGVRISTHQVDVMRGEEVQALGWYELNKEAGSQVVCLPGTHSKWLMIDSGKVINLATALTGEVFSLLSKQSLLVSGEQQWQSAAFAAGVEQARQGKGLLHSLFSTRARVVAADQPANQASSYLSGLLIGTELCEQGLSDHFHLIGASPLVSHYAEAAELLGIQTTIWDGPEMVGLGLQSIWQGRQND